MQSIITPKSQPARQLRTTVVSTVFCILLIFTTLCLLVHHWKEIVHRHPGIMAAMPLFGMATMAALLPLGLKLVYLQELSHLNPLLPSQYWQLCRRLYQTLNENSGKISEKDL